MRIYIRNTKKSKKLALLVGSWLFYLPILRGSLFPSLFGTLYGFPVPFASGSFVVLFGLPFNFPQTENIYDWIEHGEIEPHFLASRIIIAAGVAITIVGFIQAIKLFREKRLPNDGLYATVRHPQHLGIALWTLGFAAGTGRTISFMAWFTIVYFYVLLAIREEGKLAEQFGETYQLYSQNTPFMIPFINIGITLPTGGWKRIAALLTIYLAGLSILCLILALVGVSIMEDIRYH